MKTVNGLWNRIICWDNLCLAYRKCRRRKRFKPKATAFDFQWELELLALQRELVDGSYRPGPYRNFIITDPKKRVISAAPFRDRVVHHALANIIEPVFDRSFINDSYACRKNKGTHRALMRAKDYLRNHQFFLKSDIVRFFPNVDHEILLRRISRKIRDSRTMKLIRQIVASGDGILADQATYHLFPGDDLLALARSRGLPIGNLTSQFFANVMLDPLDHFIKEDLHVRAYVRYADDFVIFANSKLDLHELRSKIEEKLREMRLLLHANKTQIRPVRHGLKFLGFQIREDRVSLARESIHRFSARRRHWQATHRLRKLDFQKLRRSVQAFSAHASFGNHRGILRDLMRQLKLDR